MRCALTQWVYAVQLQMYETLELTDYIFNTINVATKT